jgi:hypothetical protein
MDKVESSVVGIFFIILGIILIAYKIWDLKEKKIHRTVPSKDWKLSRIFENFGIPRHEIITPKKHPYLYWLLIIRDFILAVLFILGGLVILFWKMF